MLYHLYDRLKLPSFAPSVEAAFTRTIQTAIKVYFHREREGLPNPWKWATKVYKDGTQETHRAFPGSLRLAKYIGEGLLGLASIEKVYNPSTDIVLGVDVPTTYVTSDHETAIRGYVDVLLSRNDKAGDLRTITALLFQNLNDPIQDMNNYDGVRRGWVYHLVRRELELSYKTQIEIAYLPVLDKLKPQLVDYEDAKNWATFIEQVLLGIRAGIAIPTADSRKCEHCPYSSICEPRLAKLGPSDEEVLKLKEQVAVVGKEMPYYERLLPRKE